jgi:hypothetical protein
MVEKTGEKLNGRLGGAAGHGPSILRVVTAAATLLN